MKNAFSILLICCLLTVFASCTAPFLHIPQTHNIPLFTDKQQLKLNAATSIRSLDLQGAYSPVKYVGVMANVQFHRYNFMPEVAAGGFYCFNDVFITEFYAGYGIAHLNYTKLYRVKDSYFRNDRNERYTVDMSSNKFFLQPDVGVRFNENVNLSLSCKISYWNISNLTYKYENLDNSNGAGGSVDAGTIKGPVRQTTYEPAITLRSGTERFSFMFQAGYMLAKKDPPIIINPYTYFVGFARVGVCFNLNFNKETAASKQRDSDREDRNFINSQH